jgi:para-nitrobenzyl esterase
MQRPARLGALLCPFCLAVLAALLASSSPGAVKDPVRVEQGLLAGTSGRNPDVRVYRGIPFAAPPVGDLRWKPPQPATPWPGIRQATQVASACEQPAFPSNGLYGGAPPPIGEDCLYLNIWTRAKSADDRLPVMVWIHGGGFDRGTGAAIGYDGENLASKGAVIVTINYRLGIFGFLALPELTVESPQHSSGNYALLDQIAALRWVQRNIAAFGGDPSRVTIFGESAGSISVNALMASPLASGLFARAIGESGGSFGPMTSLAGAEKQGLQMASSIGITQDVLKSLRAKSAESLLQATTGKEDDIEPIVDGWVLPQSIYSIFAEGKQNDVPVIVGNNANEGSLWPPPLDMLTPAAYVDNARNRYGPMADDFLKIYPPGSTTEDVATAYGAWLRDAQFGWEMRIWARMETETGHHRAYRYYFSRVPPGPGSRLGAFHGSELAYVFENFPYRILYQDADKQLGDAIATYWVNFARAGNPNGTADSTEAASNTLPKWPIYDPDKDDVLDFGDQVSVQSRVNADGLDFLDMFYRALRQSPPDAPSSK